MIERLPSGEYVHRYAEISCPGCHMLLARCSFDGSTVTHLFCDPRFGKTLMVLCHNCNFSGPLPTRIHPISVHLGRVAPAALKPSDRLARAIHRAELWNQYQQVAR